MKVEKKLIRVGNSTAIIIPDIWIGSHLEYDTQDGNNKSVVIDLRDDGTIFIVPKIVTQEIVCRRCGAVTKKTDNLQAQNNDLPIDNETVD